MYSRKMITALARMTYNALAPLFAETALSDGYADFEADGAISLTFANYGISESTGGEMWEIWHSSEGVTFDPCVALLVDHEKRVAVAVGYVSQILGVDRSALRKGGMINNEMAGEMTEFAYNWLSGVTDYNYHRV